MTTALTAVRSVAGTELPAAGRWVIDPGHAEVAFVGRHFMLTKVRGRFTGVAGEVTVADRPEDSRLDVTIDMGSVSSGDRQRDDHLRSPDLFDVEAHPLATYRSSRVSWRGTSGDVEGELTIKGITRPISAAGTWIAPEGDAFGNTRGHLTLEAVVDRTEFDMNWNAPLPSGGKALANEVTLTVELSLVEQQA
jgi:polyisoprenoid-binding protein YceI